MAHVRFPVFHRKTRARALAWVVAGLSGLLVGAGPGDSKIARYEAALDQKVAAIRHSPRERKWERIPWRTDLAAGWEEAKRENRPVFLWVAGDDPLERC